MNQREMNPNSLIVWYDKVKPKLSEKQSIVLAAIVNLETATIYQVARYLDVFPNQISGRFSELVKKELIQVSGIREESGRPHSIYKPLTK